MRDGVPFAALPAIMGHRGALALAPENTLASLRAAVEAGASWVEFDVMLTGDDLPVLFHDDCLKRTTGLDADMAETPYVRLQDLEAGAWFGPAFAGEAIPTLEAALLLLAELGAHPNVELKPTRGRDVETAVATLRVLEKTWPADRALPFVSSFSRMSLAAVRALRPDLPCGFIAWEAPDDWRAVLQALRCTSFHVNEAYLSIGLAEEIKAAGYQLAAYTVNDPARARELRAWSVDSLITDRPDRLVGVGG